MIQTTRKNLLKVSGAIGIVTLFYIFVYWPISPLGHQLHNLKLAEIQAKILREKLKDDIRFQNVKFVRYTDAGAGLSIVGKVQTEDDIRFLTNFVESIPCPVEIHYSLSASNGFVEFQWSDRRNREPRWTR
jgi:hypothetical protein